MITRIPSTDIHLWEDENDQGEKKTPSSKDLACAGRWEIQWTQKVQATEFTIGSCKQCMTSKIPLETCLKHMRKWGEGKPHIRWIFLGHTLLSTKAVLEVSCGTALHPRKNIQQNDASSPLIEKKLQGNVPPQGFLAGQWELLFSCSV